MELSKVPTRRRRVISVIAAVGLVAGICGGIATAASTITSTTYPGAPAVVRDDVVTISTDPTAVMFSRNTATGVWSVTSPYVAGGSAGAAFACRGDTGAIGAGGAGNLSPRTNVKVTGPGTVGVVLDATTPVIDTSVSGLLAGFPPFATQPAPSATNYRGGASAGGTAGNAAFAANTGTRPFVNTLNLAGKPAGIYAITTTRQNMVKSPITSGACQIGTAVPTTNAAPTLGLKLDPTVLFEYRPWQHVFKDVFDGGKVNMNVAPKEFQMSVANQNSPVNVGGPEMKLYAMPSVTPGADPVPLLLPSDPAACAANPQSCLPAGVRECPAATADCVPSVVVINRAVPHNRLQGIFDLQSKAFVAIANVNGYGRVLMSLGTANDAAYKALLAQLAAQASAKGIDLMTLLATKVRVRNGTGEYTLSLLNGLQINPSTAKAGVQIVSDFTVQAGLILNIYASLGGPVCATNVGDSNPATAAPDRYTPLTDAGYTVEKSDLLPDVPRVGAVGALVGGPIYHIKGDFVGAAPALVNTSTGVIGVDTAADEPNGYPIWIEPFVSKTNHTTVARTMDFIGTATWSASETPVTGVGCLTVDFLLGAGVALYNNPLDIGFGDIPIWDPQSPAVASLIQQINAAVQSGVDQVVGNPTVADLLAQITGSLPPVEGVPSL